MTRGTWELGWWAPVPPALEPGELVEPGVHGDLLSAVADGAPLDRLGQHRLESLKAAGLATADGRPRFPVAQAAEAKAVAANDLHHAGWRAYWLGWVHYLRDQADDVLECAGRAMAHWEKAKPMAGPRERAFAERLSGIGHEMKSNYPEAIGAYRKALDLYKTISLESEDIAIVLNDLASAEGSTGDVVTGEKDFREALRIAHAVGYSEGQAFIAGNLAAIMIDRKDWVGAETILREALRVAEEIGRREIIASNSRCLAHALIGQKKPSEAVPYAQRAVEVFTQLGVNSLIEAAQATLKECQAKARRQTAKGK